MPTDKINIQSITQIRKLLKKRVFLPVYFLFGEDSFSLNSVCDEIVKSIEPFVTIEFDRQVFYGGSIPIEEAIDFAISFPFGSEKKLVIIKEFEKNKNQDKLLAYIEKPTEFTIMILIYNDTIKNFEKEYLKRLVEKNFIFEAKELKEDEVVNWLIDLAEEEGKKLSEENASFFINIAGVDRSILKMQLEKIITNTKEDNEISFETIKNQVYPSREFNIFDLYNAIGKKDKETSFKIAFNLIEREEITMIISMLNKYFTGLAQILEMTKLGYSDQVAAKFIGTHWFYYKDYKAAAKMYPTKKLYQIAQALLEADLSVKTSATDDKTILSILITKILY